MLEKRGLAWALAIEQLMGIQRRRGKDFLGLTKGLRTRTYGWSQGEMVRSVEKSWFWGRALSLTDCLTVTRWFTFTGSQFINEERFDMCIFNVLSCATICMMLFQHPRQGHTPYPCSYGPVKTQPGTLSPDTLFFICSAHVATWIIRFTLPLLCIIYEVLFSRAILVIKWPYFPENVLFRYFYHQNYRILG